jgi:hypothetical protein
MLNTTARTLLVALLLVPLASCGHSANTVLIGEWEGKVGPRTVALTFAKGGELTLDGDIAALGTILKSFGLLTDFGIKPGKNLPITYKCVSATQLEVEGDFTALTEKLSAGGSGRPSPEMLQKLHPKDTLTFAVAGKELTLTNDQGKSIKLQKVE